MDKFRGFLMVKKVNKGKNKGTESDSDMSPLIKIESYDKFAILYCTASFLRT